MSFWDTYKPAEPTVYGRDAAAVGKRRKAERPCPQDAAMPCTRCPHVGPDVLFGICAGCATDWDHWEARVTE